MKIINIDHLAELQTSDYSGEPIVLRYGLWYYWRTMVFDNDGISVNGAAIIPWNKIDGVVLVDRDGAEDYKFRYTNHNGKIRYLYVPDNMTSNMQKAIKLAGKKLPGKFADKFPPKQKSLPDIYDGGEIVMHAVPWFGKVLCIALICVSWFLYIREPEPVMLLVSILMTSLLLAIIFTDEKIIFNDTGIIGKRDNTLIPWDDIDAVDIQNGAYIFRYSAFDGKVHSIKLPFGMSNTRKGIELAKEKRPDLFVG